MRWIIITALLLAGSAAYAQWNGCPPGFCQPRSAGSGGGTVLTCNGTGYDFTLACNSQYVGTL